MSNQTKQETDPPDQQLDIGSGSELPSYNELCGVNAIHGPEESPCGCKFTQWTPDAQILAEAASGNYLRVPRFVQLEKIHPSVAGCYPSATIRDPICPYGPGVCQVQHIRAKMWCHGNCRYGDNSGHSQQFFLETPRTETLTFRETSAQQEHLQQRRGGTVYNQLRAERERVGVIKKRVPLEFMFAFICLATTLVFFLAIAIIATGYIMGRDIKHHINVPEIIIPQDCARWAKEKCHGNVTIGLSSNDKLSVQGDAICHSEYDPFRDLNIITCFRGPDIPLIRNKRSSGIAVTEPTFCEPLPRKTNCFASLPDLKEHLVITNLTTCAGTSIHHATSSSSRLSGIMTPGRAPLPWMGEPGWLDYLKVLFYLGSWAILFGTCIGFVSF
jgi:hypothetical protein